MGTFEAAVSVAVPTTRAPERTTLSMARGDDRQRSPFGLPLAFAAERRYVGQTQMKKRHLANAPGPFYVEAGCCTFCGVPAYNAPGLFGEDDDSCFVKQQPRSPREVDRMLLAMIQAELGCIRYAGADVEIGRRLIEQGEGAVADHPPLEHIERIVRDHVGLRLSKATPRAVADSFVSHLRRLPMPERYKVELVAEDADRCDLRIAWFEDRFHTISFIRTSAAEFDWLVVGLPFFVAEWLDQEEPTATAVFFDAQDWSGPRVQGRPLPW